MKGSFKTIDQGNYWEIIDEAGRLIASVIPDQETAEKMAEGLDERTFSYETVKAMKADRDRWKALVEDLAWELEDANKSSAEEMGADYLVSPALKRYQEVVHATELIEPNQEAQNE